jgi:hypothetical protein
MIAAANGSACKLVDLVTSSFAGFRDTCIYRFILNCVASNLSQYFISGVVKFFCSSALRYL